MSSHYLVLDQSKGAKSGLHHLLRVLTGLESKYLSLLALTLVSRRKHWYR